MEDKETRRTFVKKIAYVAPLVLTLKAAPSFAKGGSGSECGGGGGNPGYPGKPPRGNPPKPPGHGHGHGHGHH